MVGYVMDMDYQKQMLGMEITRTLFLPSTLGSIEEATVTMVLMPVCSARAAAMAMPATAVFVLRWWSMERK